MLLSTILISAAEELAIGRASDSLLSDESRLELLFAGFGKELDFFQDPDDEPITDISDIDSFEKNDDGEIEAIDFEECEIGGTLELRWLPLTLKKVDMTLNHFHGTYASHLLPPALTVVHLGRNKLVGSIDLSTLPLGVRSLDLAQNCLSGTVDFSKIPLSLQQLTFFGNKLSGTVDLRAVKGTLGRSSGAITCSLWSGEEVRKDCLFLSVQHNPFVGDILVSDIAKVESPVVFSYTECESVVDGNGGVIKLKK